MSEQQRGTAVALFAQGLAYTAVATHLGVRRWPVRSLYRRWLVHGTGALVSKNRSKSYSFEFKHDVVQRALAGTPVQQLAQEFELSSEQLVRAWVRAYRTEGEDGLRPKPKGRPKGSPPPQALSELEKLQRENLKLRAENAYLKKLRDLMAQGRQ